ncbi:hypothetical protein BKA63DRAFT_240427 [Paraphoma chrysanthemicola]|nr:hypothetical protein BKA63DRAFT_240427 [Paraphoma chrysanthemicola]
MIATSPFLGASRKDNADRVMDESDLQYVGYGIEHSSGLSRVELNRSYSISMDDDPLFTGHQGEPLTRLHIGDLSEQNQPLTSYSLAGLQDEGATTFSMENWIQGRDQHAPFSDRLFSRGIIRPSTLSSPPIQTTRAANPEPPAPTTPHNVPNVQILLPPTSDTPADLLCPDCSQKFVGEYRRGNLLRHMRSSHSGLSREYHCEAEGCERVFKRQDARLKHYRNKHPHLYSAPARRRP